MWKNYGYRCSECGKEYNTSGPWEFYRNRKGERIPYGHPGPLTEEARLSGIHGFFANMLCLDCGREVDVILEDFYKQPTGFIESLKRLWKKDDENEIRCPHCKSTDLLLDKEEGHGIICPGCRQGKLELIDYWES